MKKYMLLLFIAKTALACPAKDETYYLNHPKVLQEATQACPDTPPKHLSCKEIGSIGQHMQNLAYELQDNPQQFGIRILSVQQIISEKQAALAADPNNKQLATELSHNQQELLYRLAVVKWLESPRK
jgi:hypothetical protein